MKNCFLIFLTLFLILNYRDTIIKDRIVTLVPIDCGPLARNEFGVVFNANKQDKVQTYFLKGDPFIICPCLTESKTVEGYEVDLCRNYIPENKYECGLVKEFVLLNCNTKK